ncbi:MAG: porin family protein [Bacteroidales bacterium]|nr:porin family protein [Bacteroidales bacterium]
MKIKNFVLASALVLGGVMSANAQKDEAFLGAKVGMNIASMTNSEGADPRIGLSVGVLGEYFITDMFAVQGEVLYSMQGNKHDVKGVTSTLKNDYLSIPVLAKVYPMMGQGFNIFAGPQFAFNVNASGKISGLNIDVKDEVEPFDFGIALGLGYDAKCGFLVDARWTPSLTNTFKNNGVDSKNSVFTISVGYKF